MGILDDVELDDGGLVGTLDGDGDGDGEGEDVLVVIEDERVIL